jgi:hypothetical protein
MQPVRRCLSRIHIPQSFQLSTTYVDVCFHPDSHTLHIKTVSSQKKFNYIGIDGQNSRTFQASNTPTCLTIYFHSRWLLVLFLYLSHYLFRLYGSSVFMRQIFIAKKAQETLTRTLSHNQTREPFLIKWHTATDNRLI